MRWSSLDSNGQASASAWHAAGGDYVGLGCRGRPIDLAVDATWVDVDYGYISGNAIVKVDYEPDDSVAAGFREDGYAFLYRSAWFTDWGDLQVSARIDDGDFLVSGYWEDWDTSGAAGMPVIVHDSDGQADVTLIGINNTFRGHPEDTFRILGNAIYNGFDQHSRSSVVLRVGPRPASPADRDDSFGETFPGNPGEVSSRVRTSN